MKSTDQPLQPVKISHSTAIPVTRGRSLPHLIFQKIPPFHVRHSHDQPGTQTTCTCKPEPVQCIRSQVIDHPAEHRCRNTKEGKKLKNFLVLFFIMLLTARKIIFFFRAGNLLFFQDLKEISLNAVVRELGGKAQNHFSFIRTGTELKRPRTGKNTRSALYNSGILPVISRIPMLE